MNPALQYAEQTLGVHAVYNEANSLAEKLDKFTTDLDTALDKRRVIEEAILDREADLLIEERVYNPSQSATWMDQHMRVQKRKDKLLVSLRQTKNELTSEISGLELDIDVLKSKLKIKVARLEELNGYFQYLAAVKLSTIKP